jgi:hypothetical protein
MNNKIQELKKRMEKLKEDYPPIMWSWQEEQLVYLLSEYNRLTSELTSANTRVESLNKALHDGVPAGMKTAEEFLDWLYSVLPFLVEDGDKE